MTQFLFLHLKKLIFAFGMSSNFKYVPGDPLPWHYKYEHSAVTTDCVIFTYEDWKLKVLLVRRGGEPYKGEWAFPGGFLRNDESAQEGALRELLEETSLIPSSPIVEFGVFSDPDRDPRERVITIAWYALVKPSEVLGGDDAEEAAWFAVDELPSLAFDHQQIFEAAMARLRRDIHFQPVGFDLLDEEFTIPDLQRLYEAILGVKFDRRNFQRKILASGILEEAQPEREKSSISFSFSGPKDSCDMDDACLEEPVALREAGVCYGMAEPQIIPNLEESRQRKTRPGRLGTIFRLNRRKYDELKEDGLKQEF